MEWRKRLNVTHLYVLRSDMTGILKAGRAAFTLPGADDNTAPNKACTCGMR